MTNKSPYISLKASITIALLTVSLISLFFAVASTTYFGNKKNEESAVRYIQAISDIVAFNSQVPISFNQRSGLNRFLATLKNIDEISNIHIYRIDDLTGDFEFFASFNQSGYPPVSPQFKKVTELTTPQFNGHFIEFGAPIYEADNTTVLGHVYIRMHMSSFNENVSQLVQYNLGIAVIIVIIAFIFSRFIRQRILLPINHFVKDIQGITLNKSFSVKVDTPQFTEMHVLAHSINRLLNTINEQIHKYTQAEKEITELNQNLEEKVVTRTQALRDSNQELLEALEQVHQYQSQVIESEKMASLGQMVAGVAHEVNTPIGLGVTASTMLEDRIAEIKEHLENQTLSAKKLSRFLDESSENTQIIYRNLSRAADLISSFKQVAVDQTADTAREIQALAFLEDVVMSLHPTLKKLKHKVELHCDSELKLNTKPGPLNQILFNLIMNSVTHAFDETDSGLMTITVTLLGNICRLEYQDNGKGIEEKIKQKIFDPFVTTRRGEGGSGLGMHLVYNLVTQALNGNIDVESQLGHGATFTIEFPIIEAQVYDAE